MSTETSPRAVRFSQGEAELIGDKSKHPPRPIAITNITTDSDGSGSSGDYTPDPSDPVELERHDELGSLARYADGNTPGSIASLAPNSVANSTSSRQANGTTTMPNGTSSRQQQRPLHLTRTPSSTYAPQRGPNQTPYSINTRSGSRPRRSDDPADKFRNQEPAYLRFMRQDQGTNGYFDPYTPSLDYSDDESEGETPSSESIFDDRYNDETIMFYNTDENDLHPTEDDVKDPDNRERLEWHGMLAAVLTGDVVKQEKKRLIGSSEQQGGKLAHKAELWIGLRSKICGRSLAVQRRLIEEARGNLDRTIDEIIRFEVKGESEAGKPPIEQIRDVVRKIEKCESLYPSWAALGAEHETATSPAFIEACDALLSWYNTNELINTELSILKKWVGNDELDFQMTKQRSPSTNGLSDETSFLDRLMKEDGLKSLHDDNEEEKQRNAKKTKTLIRRSMLTGISTTIAKAKETLILNSVQFKKRHLPPYIEEILILISFPSRLIEEIIKVRLTYAKKMKETTQQNAILQDQMISQFEILLKLGIRIKQEYITVSQPQAGWQLPPLIDDSFDQVVLDALKYYFKMLNWKLSRNKNTFKEAEVLFQEWDFANEIGRNLQGGDIEVAEQFSTLTFKALNRLSQTFERELQRKPKESADAMTTRYKQVLESVRVRQRMLQRFSRMLTEYYENASDLSIAFPPDHLQRFYDQLSLSGHFLVDEIDGIQIIASPTLVGRDDEVQSILRTCFHEPNVADDPSDPYVLILRPETSLHWFGNKSTQPLNIDSTDLKVGQLRLIATGSQYKLTNARKAFLESIEMHLDLLVEQRSNLHKVNSRLMEIRKVAFKLSNTFMDSVEIIRKQTEGVDCAELIQTCFVFATEFGQRSLLSMDSNRRQMNNMKLTKLALDWVSFICDDCAATDRRSFRWAVPALEFAMGMTRGRHILGLDPAEYARLRAKVSGCMSLLISHFDILGAKSNQAAQSEKERIEALVGQSRRIDKNRMLDDEEAFKYIQEQRLEKISNIDELQRQTISERQGLGRVLEVSNEVDRSLAYLSSSATNVTMRWQQGHFVGGGTFGNVYAAMNLDTGHLMAVKEIRLQDPKLIPQIATQIKDEMGVLEVLDHPNVVSYYGIEVHRDRVYIFMEFCSGGSLANLLEHGRIEDEQVTMVYALQLLEGLAYLHESGIAHRDIKPENILLDHNGVIKYVDFGAAKVIARQGRTLVHNGGVSMPQRSMTGTPMYMSPEVIKGDNPGRAGAVDIWSLGCVILEMATGRRPWSNLDNEWAIMYNIAQGNPPQLPSTDQLSEQGINFLNKCFVRDPKKRASAVELLQHEWILNIRRQVVESPTTPSDSGSAICQTIPHPNSAHSAPNSAPNSAGSTKTGADSFY